MVKQKTILIFLVSLLGFSGSSVRAAEIPSAGLCPEMATVAYSTYDERFFLVWKERRCSDPSNSCDNDKNRPPASSASDCGQCATGNCGYSGCGKDYGLCGNGDLKGQFLNREGNPVGQPFVIAGDPPFALDHKHPWLHQEYPFVSYNSQRNEFLVAWQEMPVDAIDEKGGARNCDRSGGICCYDIAARRVTANGSLGQTVKLSSADDCQWVPQIAYDSINDKYLVIWHDHRHRGTATEKEIYGQLLRYSPAGELELQGSNFSVTRETSGYQEYSSIVFNSTLNKYFAVWGDKREGKYNIYGQFVNPDGTFDGPNKHIFGSGDSFNHEKPSVAFLPQDDVYIISWTAKDSAGNSKPMAKLLDQQGRVVRELALGENFQSYFAITRTDCQPLTNACLIAWAGGNKLKYAIFNNKTKEVEKTAEVVSIGWMQYLRAAHNNSTTSPKYLIAYNYGLPSHLYYNTVNDPLLPGATATPTPSQKPTPTVSPTVSPPEGPPIGGIGACHWVPSFISEAGMINWGYETSLGRGVFWRELEPSPDQFDFRTLNSFINSFSGTGAKIWLAIQTSDSDLYNQRKAPLWLDSLGAKWFACQKSRDIGIFAPWDEVYLWRLRNLLERVNGHIQSQSAEYKKTIGGIIMNSGGFYGEMQLWSGNDCQIKDRLKEDLASRIGGSVDEQKFNEEYYKAISKLVEIYMSALADMPVAIQLGYNTLFIKPGGSQKRVDEAVVEDKVSQYGRRLILKWNGLDPTNVGDSQDDIRERQNSYYRDLFLRFKDQTQVGYEAGHPELYQNPVWSGNWDENRFRNVFSWALSSKASFVCFQPSSDPKRDILTAVQQIPGWTSFDQALEANLGNLPTVTPAPVNLKQVISRYGQTNGVDQNGDGLVNGLDFSARL